MTITGQQRTEDFFMVSPRFDVLNLPKLALTLVSWRLGSSEPKEQGSATGVRQFFTVIL